MSSSYLFGPSHAVRLQHAITTGQLPDILGSRKIIGSGGMPLWNKRVTRVLSDDVASLHFVVGDFRFGNKVFRHHETVPEGPVEGDYLGIDKDYITPEKDQLLYDHCLRTAEAYVARFGDRVRFLFWDLSIREYENRATNKYMVDGIYRHPSWNLDGVLARFGDVSVDTTDVLQHGQLLYIDSSAHPSLAGWVYVLNSFRPGAPTSISAAADAIQRFCVERIEAAVRRAGWGETVFLTGDSIFTRVTDRLVKAGILALPPQVRIVSLQEALGRSGGACIHFPSLSAHPMTAEEIEKGIAVQKSLVARLERPGSPLVVLPYDNWARERISERSDYLGQYVSKLPEGRTAAIEAALCPAGQGYRITDSDADFEGMIELNNTLLPTTLGFLTILVRAIAGASQAEVKADYDRLCGILFAAT